jgi:hypothetical protein
VHLLHIPVHVWAVLYVDGKSELTDRVHCCNCALLKLCIVPM